MDDRKVLAMKAKQEQAAVRTYFLVDFGLWPVCRAELPKQTCRPCPNGCDPHSAPLWGDTCINLKYIKMRRSNVEAAAHALATAGLQSVVQDGLLRVYAFYMYTSEASNRAQDKF